MNTKIKGTAATIILLIIILTSTLVAIPTRVNAETTVTKYFGIEARPDDVSQENWGYSILEPKSNLAGDNNSTVIWNIREYQAASANSQKIAGSSKDIYCVKAGVGFGSELVTSDASSKRKEYKVENDMKSEASVVAGSGTGKLNINSNTDDGYNRYDCLLALLDNLYLLDDENKNKVQFLSDHNALPDGYTVSNGDTEYILTEGDIVAVQQAAIWYFTNYETKAKFDKTGSDVSASWLWYTTNGTKYNSLSDYDQGHGDEEYQKGSLRNKSVNKLYNNLIREAKANSAKYAKYRENSVDTGAPVKITSDTLTWKLSSDRKNYLLGPITSTKNENNPSEYTIDFTITDVDNSRQVSGYSFTDESGVALSEKTVKDIVKAGKTFYVSIPVAGNGKSFKINSSVKYNNATIKYYTNADGTTQPLAMLDKEQKNEDKELSVKVSEFDLKLIKRITAVNETPVPERLESVDITKLANGESTTADYKLNKTPVVVKNGDIVTYAIRVYNEGDIDGYAEEITENIPDGLKYLYQSDPDYENYSEEEKAAAGENDKVWTIKPLVENRVNEVTTDILSRAKNESDNLIKAFDKSKPYSDTDPKNPDYKEVTIKMKVVSDDNDLGNPIKNEAKITKDKDKDGNEVEDRDSSPEEDGDNEDDEDYDNVVLEYFDISLRKFIIAVSSDETIESEEYLKDENGQYTRAPKVDTSKLNTVGEDGKTITTSEYNHTKAPVKVSEGNIVVYNIRVYNEGSIDGYAAEIKDHLPPYLEYVDGDFNDEYGWSVSKDGRTVTSTYLKDKILKAAKLNENPSSATDRYTLSYEDIPIMCKLTDTAPTEENITNIADITVYENDKHESVKDRDSKEGNVELPKDDELPDYKGNETGSYVPGQEDDDDFEKVIISEKEFDLALRKFIAAVSHDQTIEDSEYLKNSDGKYEREPEVDTSKLNTMGEDGKMITTAEYNHPKTPVNVSAGDIVIYMLRVYNEADQDGYAAEITDHLPSYLEFVEGEFNDKYKWVVSEDGKTVKTDYLKDYLIKKATKVEGGYELDYQEVPIMCRVIETAPSDENITNIAEITSYEDENHKPVEDRDSEEDNTDIENVVIKEFDLALKKWVTQAIVTDSNGTTVTNTGHQPYDEPEDIVKVEIHRKKINEVTVKFKYAIRVINEGDIEGYATEITDYVPQGLKFVAEDNPKWTDKGNNVITTNQLADKLLKPGEYADIEVILTWTNGSNNMGLKTNTAEISEDKNEYGIPDKDSTPNNKKKGEDDTDEAPIMLSISTGKAQTYITIGFVILITIAGGIVIIKKYVL